jgi:hypothetical protein
MDTIPRYASLLVALCPLSLFLCVCVCACVCVGVPPPHLSSLSLARSLSLTLALIPPLPNRLRLGPGGARTESTIDTGLRAVVQEVSHCPRGRNRLREQEGFSLTLVIAAVGAASTLESTAASGRHAEEWLRERTAPAAC